MCKILVLYVTRMEAQRKRMVIPWKKKTLVSGNVGDEKNTRWGG